MANSEQALDLREFVFGASTLTVRCRDTLDRTIQFKQTMQCSVADLFASMLDFGGGMPSDSDPESPTTAQGPVEAPFDPLGLDVWPAALELCAYLAWNPHLVQGRAVLELGAGVGLPGLLAAQLGALRVVLTDYEPRVVDHVLENAALCGVSKPCTGLCLDWTKLEQLPQEHRGVYSLVLAADVLYIQEIMEGFVQAADALLAPGGVLIVGHQQRRSLVMNEATGMAEALQRDVPFHRFKALCAEAGLHIWQLGSRESPSFPGPLLMLAVGRDVAALHALPLAFQDQAAAAEAADAAHGSSRTAAAALT